MFLSAPFIGSFLGVVAVRWPAGDSFVKGRSRCPSCHHQLTTVDLIPLLSFLFRRGRCGYCGTRISNFYPLMELAALLVAFWAWGISGGSLGLFMITCLLGWTLLALAVIDYRHFLLPDFLTLPLIIAGIAAISFLNPDRIYFHIIGAIAGAVFLYLIAWGYEKWRGRAGIGFGDVKLFAAAGAWVGADGLPSVLFIAALSGLLIAGILAVIQKQKIDATTKISFGTYLCLGTWAVWLYGPLMI